MSLDRALRVAAIVLVFVIIVRIWTFNISLTTDPIATTDDPTVAALEAQIAQERRYQEQLIQIVLWSIGGVMTIGVLLVGYGWYQNRIVYDRDRDALTQALGANIESVRAQIENTQTQHLEEQRIKLTNAIEVSAKDAVQQAILYGEHVSTKTESRLDDLNVLMLDIRGDLYELKDLQGAAFLFYLQALSAQKSQGDENGKWVAANLLLKIENIITTCDNEIDAGVIRASLSRVNTLLNQYQSILPGPVTTIRQLLTAKFQPLDTET